MGSARVDRDLDGEVAIVDPVEEAVLLHEAHREERSEERGLRGPAGLGRRAADERCLASRPVELRRAPRRRDEGRGHRGRERPHDGRREDLRGAQALGAGGPWCALNMPKVQGNRGEAEEVREGHVDRRDDAQVEHDHAHDERTTDTRVGRERDAERQERFDEERRVGAGAEPRAQARTHRLRHVAHGEREHREERLPRAPHRARPLARSRDEVEEPEVREEEPHHRAAHPRAAPSFEGRAEASRAPPKGEGRPRREEREPEEREVNEDVVDAHHEEIVPVRRDGDEVERERHEPRPNAEHQQHGERTRARIDRSDREGAPADEREERLDRERKNLARDLVRNEPVRAMVEAHLGEVPREVREHHEPRGHTESIDRQGGYVTHEGELHRHEPRARRAQDPARRDRRLLGHGRSLPHERARAVPRAHDVAFSVV